jgi:hypothetical protein
VTPQYPICNPPFFVGVMRIFAGNRLPSFRTKTDSPSNLPVELAMLNHVGTFWRTVRPGEKRETRAFPITSLAVYPKISSAPALKVSRRPSMSQVIVLFKLVALVGDGSLIAGLS